MKISFSLFLQCTILTSMLGQDKVTYTPVEITPEMDSCIIFREMKDTSIYFGKFYYDTLARVDSSVIYGKYGSRLLFESFKYDKQGRLVEAFSHDLPDEVGMYSATDNSEWLRERRWHNRQTLERKKYDANNNLIEMKGYATSFDAVSIKEEEDLGFVGAYFYNDSNCLIKKTEHYVKRGTSDGSKYIDTTFFECDAQNNHLHIIEKEHQKQARNEYHHYDASNNLMKSERCYNSGKSCSTYLYEYDALSNYKSFKKIDEEGIEYESHQYTYEDTLLKHYLLIYPRGDTTEMFFEYDSLGVITLSHTRTLDGRPYRSAGGMTDSYKYKMKYDSMNRVIEKEFYWKKNKKKKFEAREEYFYNDKNQVIKTKEYDQSNSLRKIVFSHYNNKGLVNKEITLDKDSMLQDVQIYFYDSFGAKIAREIHDEDGFITLFQTYKYDDDGNETGGVHYHDKYQEIIYRYYYQADGTYDYVHVQKKKGNKIIEDFNLRYHHF